MILRKFSEDEPNLFWIVWEGEVIGSLSLMPYGDTLVIQELTIIQEGIVGRKFLKELEAKVHGVARSRGYSKVAIQGRGPRNSRVYLGAGYSPSSDFGPYFYEKDLERAEVDRMLDDISKD